MLKQIHNPSSIKLYLFLLLTFSLLIINTHSQCHDYNYPTAISRKKVMRDCKMVNEKKLTGDKLSESSTTNNNNNMFDITFNCGSNDTVLCGKAQTAFETAGQLITSVLSLNTPITVNASFLDFCAVLNDCPSGGLITLGGASPASFQPLQDDDNLIRLYPQALVKQFQFKNHLEYGPVDIVAMFNSGGTSFWFQGDPTITPVQQDFLYVVLHEMIHGLGFGSSWQDYFNNVTTSMTPEPLVNSETNDPNQPVVFSGFFETAFDKYMINTKKSIRMSTVTNQLNQFAGKLSLNQGITFQSFNDLLSKLMSSPVYQLTTDMLTLSTTPNSLAILSHTNNSVTLETTLNPFRPGSSVSHVDLATYNNTSDFLMKFLSDRGATLSDLIQLRSNNTAQVPSSLNLAIGPNLINVLETLGYATKNNPNPYKPSPKLVSNSLNSTDANTQPTNTGTDGTNGVTSKSSSMIIKPNLIFTSIFIIISMLIKLIYQS